MLLWCSSLCDGHNCQYGVKDHRNAAGVPDAVYLNKIDSAENFSCVTWTYRTQGKMEAILAPIVWNPMWGKRQYEQWGCD